MSTANTRLRVARAVFPFALNAPRVHLRQATALTCSALLAPAVFAADQLDDHSQPVQEISPTVITGVDNRFNKAYAEHLNLAGNAGFDYPANGPQAINEPGRTLRTKVDMSL